MGKKFYKCDLRECQKLFSSKFSLKRHNLMHLNTKKHICKHCQKAFVLPQYLEEHEYTHTGQKPFVCGINGCPEQFRQRGKLSIHKKNTHPEVRCDQNFVQSNSLNVNSQQIGSQNQGQLTSQMRLPDEEEEKEVNIPNLILNSKMQRTQQLIHQMQKQQVGINQIPHGIAPHHFSNSLDDNEVQITQNGGNLEQMHQQERHLFQQNIEDKFLSNNLTMPLNQYKSQKQLQSELILEELYQREANLLFEADRQQYLQVQNRRVPKILNQQISENQASQDFISDQFNETQGSNEQLQKLMRRHAMQQVQQAALIEQRNSKFQNQFNIKQEDEGITSQVNFKQSVVKQIETLQQVRTAKEIKNVPPHQQHLIGHSHVQEQIQSSQQQMLNQLLGAKNHQRFNSNDEGNNFSNKRTGIIGNNIKQEFQQPQLSKSQLTALKYAMLEEEMVRKYGIKDFAPHASSNKISLPINLPFQQSESEGDYDDDDDYDDEDDDDDEEPLQQQHQTLQQLNYHRQQYEQLMNQQRSTQTTNNVRTSFQNSTYMKMEQIDHFK